MYFGCNGTDDKTIEKEVGANVSTLDSLQSKEQLQLLDEIDKLRAFGVNEFVSLPQLTVCGDQSSGKSSVLEAITEIPFPRKDNLCTRFATQIVLRRGPKTKVLVKILPDSKRSEEERKKLAGFTGSLENFGDLPALIESAQDAMGIAPGCSAFSRDVLSIEISGPGRPQLTVVDLPGLTHTENKSQSRGDVELVSELVNKYMSDPRTIILAIVTAKNDYANQIVLKRAKEVDPEGARTLGIITKPDTLPVGSDSEDEFLTLAKNEDIFFKLGWHVLRNRSYEERSSTFADRNRAEQAFFERGVWKALPRDTVGISTLRSRLSVLLLNRIKQELPRVYKEIGDSLRDCESHLQRLGQRRSTAEEQRVFLSKISESFGRLCKAASDGIYEEEFFGDAMSTKGQLKRLRAAVQNLNSSFAEKMRTKGHLKHIVEDGQTTKADEILRSDPSSKKPMSISPNQDLPLKINRKEAINWVKPLLLRSRGRELPGTYNPLLIGELFWEQSKGWEELAKTHLQGVWKICRKFLEITLREIAPDDVMNSLFVYWIDGKMQERLDKANGELRSLLADRRRHAITYNYYCTDNMQRARTKRLEEKYMAAINSVVQSGTRGTTVTLDPLELLDALAAPNQENMDDYACEEVLDGMAAFYKVACKVFVDNVAVQVVERQVLGGLWEIFSPSSVAGMKAELIFNISEESQEDQQQRDQLEAKLESLRMGLEICRAALKGVRTGMAISNLCV